MSASSTAPPAQLVSAGCINVDLLARVPSLPGSDGRVVCEHPFQRSLGGMATNVACAAAALGGLLAPRVALIGPLATDPDGAWVLKQLAQHGVETGWLDRQSPYTNRCLILLEPDGRRALIGEPSRLDYQQIHRRLQSGASQRQHLHCDGYHAPGLLKALTEARQRGWSTSADVDELPPAWLNTSGIQALLDRCDWLFINHAYASQVCASSDPDVQTTQLGALLGAGGGGVLLTLGERGSRLISVDKVIPVPALTVAVRDTTGAGDVFAGVFLASWLAGLDPPVAARQASVAAGLSTTAVGALGYLPDNQQVLAGLAALAAQGTT